MSKNTDKKVEKKVSKIDRKVARKTAKCAMWLVAVCLGFAMTGCATAELPTEQPNDQASLQAGKSETITANFTESQVIVVVGAKKLKVDPVVTNGQNRVAVEAEVAETSETYDISVLSQAQSLKSEGTETFSPQNTPKNDPHSQPTATPTNEVKTDVKATYGLQSDSASGASWIDSLVSSSAQGLAAWLKGGKANGTMTVTKKDGTTETVTCKDGRCTNAAGDCITCREGGCADGSCSE